MNGEPASGSIGRPSPPSLLYPELSQESDSFDGWRTIGEQQDFYNEQDCLHPSHNLASEKLWTRGENDVAIFDYSLGPRYLALVDGDSPVEEDGPSSGHFSADDDLFFLVPKDKLIESERFDQIIDRAEGSPLRVSHGQRLGIIDFPQCYDTYDDDLLYSMGEKLGLLREDRAAFMGAYLQRVRQLPGHGRFRTGISLRAPLKGPSGLPWPGLSEHRFILFVSFPYFGESSQEIALGSESETVRLLDFGSLGIDVPDHSAVVREEERDEERDDIREILVHQARYMVFDNNIMAIFKSKEDSAKDRAPLHRYQERIGAFRAMTHMIANRAELESRTLEKLQASLCKLERGIHEMISDAETYENDQAMKKKQDRIRDLLISLDMLAAGLFAAISVAERQIIILRDLHGVLSTSYRTKTKDYEKGYPLRRNPFYNNIVPVPILSENPQQIWPNTLETIDEIVREREYFIRKIRGLVENMDIRRKILSVFLKSDQAKAAPSEKTAQETAGAVKRTEDAIMGTTHAIERTQAVLVQQGQTLTSFTIVTTAFLPLSFCASYFGMNIKEFNRDPISLSGFWLITGPVLFGILLLTAVIALWKRPAAVVFRYHIKWKLGLSPWRGMGLPMHRTMMAKPDLEKKSPWSRRERTRGDELV